MDKTDSADFYVKLLNNIPADIVAFNSEHKYIFINKGAISDDNLREWLIGKDDEAYFNLKGISNERAIERRKHFTKALKEKQINSFIEKFTNSQTGETTYKLRIFKPVVENNHVDLVVGYGLDVTQLKQSELENQILHTAIESSPEGIAILDADGVYTYMNKAHSEIFEAPKKDFFIGKKWHAIYSKDEIERIERDIFPKLLAEGSWSGETIGRTIKGKPLFQHVTLNLTPDNGLICTTRNITESIKQSTDLKRLKIVAGKTNSFVIVTNVNGQIEWVNEAFEQTTGYCFEEVIGKTPDFLHGPETDPATVKKIWGAVNKQKAFTGEITSYTKSRKKIYLYINLTPVFDDNGVLINYISVENDITELKIAERKKLKAEKKQKELSGLKSDFVSMVSHEFRTPIAVIQSSTEIIKSILNQDTDSPVFSVLNKHSSRIESELNKMTELMNKVLAIGKINANKIGFNPVKTDLLSLIYNVAEIYTTPVDGKSKIAINVSGTPYDVFVDPYLLEQVIRNLISNAVKFSESAEFKPVIYINFSEQFLEVAVKDFGIGVPDENKQSLFEPFYRASNASSYQGTGLGMSIIKRFLDLHGIAYRVETELNKGFVFEMKIKNLYG